MGAVPVCDYFPFLGLVLGLPHQVAAENGRDQLARDSPWLSNVERREFDGITREQ